MILPDHPDDHDLESLASLSTEARFERLVTRWVMACVCVVPALAVLSGGL